MKKTERFKREGEHLPLNQLREELRGENERRERAGEKKLVDSYIKRNNIPAFPRPELHVSHISHCTDLTGLTGIKEHGGFKDPKDLNVVWFSLMVSPDELRDAETRPVTLVRPGGAEEPLRPQRRPQAEEEPLEEQLSRLTVSETELLLQSFATSSAFKSSSRYGSFRFTFRLRDVLHKYSQKFCGEARPVFRVYQTVLYQQEVMYAVLVHSPVNENMFSDLPLLEDTPQRICAFSEIPQPHFVWRPQAMSETHRFELVENQGHISTQRVRCKRFVWDHVALALHVGDEVLMFGDQELRSSLTFCDRNYPPVRRATRFEDAQAEVKKLWPDHGDLQKFNEAELNVTDSRATPNLSRATPSSTMQDKDDKTEAVKILMEEVRNKLKDCNHDVAAFLRKSISELDEEKKELVGVFGRSGLGKSSLINAVLDKEGLLPTNKHEACTSVIIKAEANSENNTFMAVVEFISVEDFESEMDLLSPYFGPEGEDCEEEYDSKLTALFGEEWKKQPLDSFKKTSEYKHLKKIVENKTKGISYSESQKKTFREALERYTNAACEDDEGASAKPWPPRLWPVVKSVTIKVPNNDLLRHVTLVDLPGTGDYNKARNEMWKQMLSSCGTVWVVAGPNRAASETEAWQIMDSAWRHMGHGGECHTIHFICTKLDQITDDDEDNVADEKEKVKKKVNQKIIKNKEFKRHFSDNIFKVFTVSAKEYFKKVPRIKPEENEISELQEYIRNLNSREERVSRYVCAAFGILSLMKGAHTLKDHQIKQVRQSLYESVEDSLQKILSTIEDWYEEFDQSLTEGVANAKQSYQQKLPGIYSTVKKSQYPYMTLKSVVEKNGVHKPGKGKEINLNTALSSFLTESIDEHFRTVFPNDDKLDSCSFWDIIEDFSLNTKELLQEYPSVKLSLRFLKQEENKLKRKLCQEILNRKKSIYSCLTETVQREMQPCYKEVRTFTGAKSLDRMRERIKQRLEEKESTMFDQAKDKMLKQLNELRVYVKEEFETHMGKVMDLSLSHDQLSGLPDISAEFAQVEEIYKSLRPKEN